jgi:hypothetical protein
MLKQIVVISCSLMLLAACSSAAIVPAVPVVPTSVAMNPTVIPTSAATIPATSTSGAMPTALPPASTGVAASYGPVSLMLPPGLASGINGSQFPRNEGQDLPYWEVTPGHTVLNLEGYSLQGKFHQPQIFIYPAQAYVEMLPGAFESIHRLDNILYGPSAPIRVEQLPAVPFFNAQQVFATNVQQISFQNGGGVRFVAEYAQYPASANNQDLFYEFQGVSRDGAYYIVVILPISNPALAETSDAGAVLPVGGIPYPDLNAAKPDLPGYYDAVTNLLNAQAPEAFAPTINQLDMLIQSMQVEPLTAVPTVTPAMVTPIKVSASPRDPSVSGVARWGKQPVPNAIVELRTGDWRVNPNAVVQRAMTDPEGRYFMANVPAGDFVMCGLFPEGVQERSTCTPVHVEAGQDVAGIDVMLLRTVGIVTPPVDVLVVARPTLSWASFPNAAQYEVFVIDAGTTELLVHEFVADTKYTVTAALLDGRTYNWVVNAVAADGGLLADGESRFVMQP